MSWRGGFDGHRFTKEEFTKYVAGLRWGNWRPSFLVLHNTASPTNKQWLATKPNEDQRVKNLGHYYNSPESKGGPQGGPWDGGPHGFVSQNGIWVGTPLTVPGVHSPSWNAFSWGLEMAGDFDSEPFPDALRDNAVHFIATLYAALGREPETIRFHKEDPRTTHKRCPGVHVVKSDIIKRVGDAMVAMHPGGHDHPPPLSA